MIEYTVKVYPDGDKFWFLNGEYHREDGPAIEYADGTNFWYLNGKSHREDGPAIEYADGTKSWYLNDHRYTEQQFNEKINPKVSSLRGKIRAGVVKLWNWVIL
jgi:adenosylmethionine-8-amino-7-oxononanoate aminotransferase